MLGMLVPTAANFEFIKYKKKGILALQTSHFMPSVQFCHLEVLVFSSSFLWDKIYQSEVERIQVYFWELL